MPEEVSSIAFLIKMRILRKLERLILSPKVKMAHVECVGGEFEPRFLIPSDSEARAALLTLLWGGSPQT